MQTSSQIYSAPGHRDLLTLVNAHELTKRPHRGERIYGTGDPVDHWYRLVSGMARNSALFSDGRRRIVDCFMPAFCERHGWRYDFVPLPPRPLILRSYADNFQRRL